MTAPILSLPPSPQSHKDLILSSHSELHIKPVHCYVCVCICVSWLGMWPLAEEKNVSVSKCLIVCLRFDKQAFLRKVCLTVGLSDKLPFWRKAYGLGRANKYTPRKSQLLTPGQRKLRSKGCIETNTLSSPLDVKSRKHGLNDWYWSKGLFLFVCFLCHVYLEYLSYNSNIRLQSPHTCYLFLQINRNTVQNINQKK